MLRLLAQLTLSLLANALGLFVANLLLDQLSIDALAFIAAAAIFSLATTILGPLITKIALTNAPYLVGSTALVTTFVGLVVTRLTSNGILIDGLNTWVLATLIVWLFSLIGSVLLPLVLFKKVLEKNKKEGA